MQTKLLVFVPVILIAGLLIGVWGLRNAAPPQAACTLGNCPLQLGSSQSGKMFVYGLSTRFSLYLNNQQNPKRQLSVSCSPENAISEISDAPQAQPPYYSMSFETAEVGTCTIKNGAFVVAIQVQPRTH